MNLINFQKCRAMTNVLADCSQCGAVNQIKAQKTGDDHFIKWTDSTLGQIVIIAQERERRNQELPLVKRRHPSSTPRRGGKRKKSASPIHKKKKREAAQKKRNEDRSIVSITTTAEYGDEDLRTQHLVVQADLPNETPGIHFQNIFSPRRFLFIKFCRLIKNNTTAIAMFLH